MSTTKSAQDRVACNTTPHGPHDECPGFGRWRRLHLLRVSGTYSRTRVHLLDSEVPEPHKGGDPSGILCAPFLWDDPTYGCEDLGPQSSPSALDVAPQACGRCARITWAEYLAEVSNGA